MQHTGLISSWKKHSGADSFRLGPCGLANTIAFPPELVRLLLPILLDNHKLFPKRREQTRTLHGMCRQIMSKDFGVHMFFFHGYQPWKWQREWESGAGGLERVVWRSCYTEKDALPSPRPPQAHTHTHTQNDLIHHLRNHFVHRESITGSKSEYRDQLKISIVLWWRWVLRYLLEHHLYFFEYLKHFIIFKAIVDI